MTSNIVVVESPAKAKTIKKYLGKDFTVMASYGHVRDLVPKEGAVDPSHDFSMKYQLIEKNERHINAIASAMRKADALYLATDPDREGEAISWHIYEILRDKKILKEKPVHRVVFHEVTKSAVNDAVEHPRELNRSLIDAQLARRALDYLVGFNLSPLLWKKIRRGLSAGRVQSPALRMIVEREEEIEKFITQEYWSIEAALHADSKDFTARLVHYDKEKLEQFSITNEDQATNAVDTLKKAVAATDGKMQISKLEKKQRKRNPAPPFITSTLQQEAARKLGFTTRRTMRIAQQLYEGIDTGDGPVGLITYMRTDSYNLANEALDEIRSVIQERYGKENLPKEIKVYKAKSKNAQEAHEAIRPTSAANIPEDLKSILSPEQFKLYDLIWKRTIACQMIHATIDTVTAHFAVGDGAEFKATGSTVRIPGFMSVYQEGKDEKAKQHAHDEDEEKRLPPMNEGDWIEVKDIAGRQHFTEPPPRYTEASLVKALEEHGIGRPSTYSSIISTLIDREYVTLDSKRFKPTDTARVVCRFLTQYFTNYVDYDFTAKLEDQLDAISRGEKEWVPVMDDFWHAFKTRVDDTEANVSRKDVVQEEIDEKCPECQKVLAIRLGRRGRFIGCTGYPDCGYTRSMPSVDGEEEEAPTAEVVEGRNCPECQSDLLIRTGRYGKFIGCSGYPECKFIEPLVKPVDTEVTCPECKQGTMISRKSRYGKQFYSCQRYPDCKYAVWDLPVADACPECEWPITTKKVTKKRGAEKLCPQKACGFREALEEDGED